MKNLVLWIITFAATAGATLSACTVSKDNLFPLVGVVAGVAWIVLFCYVNWFREDVEDDLDR